MSKNLIAPLVDRDLTAPERIRGASSVYLIETVNWVTDNGDQIVTDTGDTLVFNSVATEVAYPIELTAPLMDRDLTAPERNTGLTGVLMDRDLTAPEIL